MDNLGFFYESPESSPEPDDQPYLFYGVSPARRPSALTCDIDLRAIRQSTPPLTCDRDLVRVKQSTPRAHFLPDLAGQVSNIRSSHYIPD